MSHHYQSTLPLYMWCMTIMKLFSNVDHTFYLMIDSIHVESNLQMSNEKFIAGWRRHMCFSTPFNVVHEFLRNQSLESGPTTTQETIVTADAAKKQPRSTDVSHLLLITFHFLFQSSPFFFIPFLFPF